jgi:hypothetical protein
MEKAGRHGCILFWLPGPEYLEEGLVYGATTRFELGEWMYRSRMDGTLGLEIGSDGQFPTLHTIKYDMECNMPGKPLHSDLQATCMAGIQRAIENFDTNRPSPEDPALIRGLI